jgi:hypothetical protein
MGKKTDLTGQQFGRWSVLYRSDEKSSDNRKKYVCKCLCGVIREVDGRRLTNGTSSSCGCAMIDGVKERFTTHGMTGTATYGSWANMKQRCTNPENEEWENYGGRGIQLLDGWEDFQRFFEDMGEAPNGLSIDRVDVNGHYCKDNCRWSDNGVQSHGRRKLTYKNTTNPSRFIGVVWHKFSQKWRMKLVFKGKTIVDKNFTDDVEAAILYDKLSKEYYGDEPNKELLATIEA